MANVAAAPDSSNWHYHVTPDEMRGTTIKSAFLAADNELQFDFPYAGGSTVTIMLRDTAGHDDVALVLDKGQFVCNPFGGTVPAKFDDGPIEKFACNSTSDGSSTVMFLHPPSRFISRLRSSRRLIIEPEFFQAGTLQVTFNITGLKW